MYYFFCILSFLNKIFLPKLYKHKMENFNKFQFMILGFKYWVTKNYLKHKK